MVPWKASSGPLQSLWLSCIIYSPELPFLTVLTRPVQELSELYPADLFFFLCTPLQITVQHSDHFFLEYMQFPVKCMSPVDSQVLRHLYQHLPVQSIYPAPVPEPLCPCQGEDEPDLSVSWQDLRAVTLAGGVPPGEVYEFFSSASRQAKASSFALLITNSRILSSPTGTGSSTSRFLFL